MKALPLIILGVLLVAIPSWAEELAIPMHLTERDGVGKSIGTITAASSPYGTVFKPNLSGLTPGLHGFHVHQNPECGPGVKQGKVVPGLAAGGHHDPTHKESHQGPYGDGHLGDLPALYVDENGKATHPVLAPRVKLDDLKGRSLMIHEGGDNYSDYPKKFGGGGARMACGVVK